MATSSLKWQMLFCLSLAASPALAQVTLVESNPGANAVVTAPRTVKLSFSEKIAPTQSGVTLSMADGMAVSTKISVSEDGKTVTARPTGPFMAGQWTATWHAAGEDGRASQGSFAFTVK